MLVDELIADLKIKKRDAFDNLIQEHFLQLIKTC
jgi:hypothetical protein